MKDTSLLRYELDRLTRSRPVFNTGSVWGAYSKAVEVWSARMDRKLAQLVTAERRELKALLVVLKYKADIYIEGVRVYPPTKFEIRDSQLWLGDQKICPSQLRDGNGNLITGDSSL